MNIERLALTAILLVLGLGPLVEAKESRFRTTEADHAHRAQD